MATVGTFSLKHAVLWKDITLHECDVTGIAKSSHS